MSRLRARPTMVTMHEASNFESSRPSASNEGHSFVVRSDLTQLRCDAWLLPSDVFGHENERLARERITFGGRRSLHERLLSRSSRIMARRVSLIADRCSERRRRRARRLCCEYRNVEARRPMAVCLSSLLPRARTRRRANQTIAPWGARPLFDSVALYASSIEVYLSTASTACYRASSAACVMRLGRSSHRSGWTTSHHWPFPLSRALLRRSAIRGSRNRAINTPASRRFPALPSRHRGRR